MNSFQAMRPINFLAVRENRKIVCEVTLCLDLGRMF